MRPTYSIIIPTRNEEESIAKVICNIPKDIARHSEIIVVDHSTDMTPIIAERLNAKVIREKRFGKGSAMKTGVKFSKGNVIIFLDGDSTDPPQYIPKLLEKLEKANMVLGCRGIKNFKIDSQLVRLTYGIYVPLMRKYFNLVGFKIKGEPLAGFRVIRRHDWNRLNLKSNNFEIEAEMNIKAVESGFVIKEVPIPHLKRGGGFMNSKLATNPRTWLKILNVVIRHVRDKKIKNKLIKLHEKSYRYLFKISRIKRGTFSKY